MAFQKETEVSTCIYLLEIGSLDLEVTMIVQPGFDPNISNQDRVIYSRHSCGVVGVLNSGAPRRWRTCRASGFALAGDQQACLVRRHHTL